jgi:MFS family permease
LTFGCLPYFFGWLLTSLSASVEYLYVARFFVGIGHAVVSTSVYTIEIASDEFRGSFTAFEGVLRHFFNSCISNITKVATLV